MSNISDEKLMAYVDGELNQAERAQVAAAMDSDATIASRLAVFSETRDRLAGLYDQPMHRPAPDHLIDLILSGTAGGNRPQSPVQNPTGRSWIKDRLKNWLAMGGRGYSAAIAYSLVLVAAGLLGWHLRTININHTEGDHMLVKYVHGQLVAQGRLNLALDSSASGQKLVWTHDSNADSWVKPVFTFRTPSHSYCRQYEITLSAGAGFSGVACRGEDGRWQIRAHTAGRPARKNSNEMVPAAGARSTMIDKVVDQLIDGDVLGADEEAVVIGSKWRGTR